MVFLVNSNYIMCKTMFTKEHVISKKKTILLPLSPSLAKYGYPSLRFNNFNILNMYNIHNVMYPYLLCQTFKYMEYILYITKLWPLQVLAKLQSLIVCPHCLITFWTPRPNYPPPVMIYAQSLIYMNVLH